MEDEERAPAKRGSRTSSAKDKEAQSDTTKAAAEAPEPVREKAVAKPAREKQAPKAETVKPDQSNGAAGDDGWNGPRPGFLSVGFGS